MLIRGVVVHALNFTPPDNQVYMWGKQLEVTSPRGETMPLGDVPQTGTTYGVEYCIVWYCIVLYCIVW